MRPVLTVFIGLLAAWFCLGTALAQTKPAVPDYVTPYNGLLMAYVHVGEKDGFPGTIVDYKGWAADKRHAEAMKALQSVNPEKLTGNMAKAFWINAYNLLTIDLIIQNKEHQTIKNIGSVLDDPWRTFTWQMHGKTVRLYEIDHEKLPVHADPRLHFALVNSALSGANLRDEAYVADRVDDQLDNQVQEFLNNEKKGMKMRGTVLEVSKIFQWFATDIELKGGVAPFLRQYHPTTPANGVVQGYFPYDWSLNGTW